MLQRIWMTYIYTRAHHAKIESIAGIYFYRRDKQDSAIYFQAILRMTYQLFIAIIKVDIK